MNDSAENRRLAHECRSFRFRVRGDVSSEENLEKRNLRRLTLINEFIAAIFLSFREESFSVTSMDRHGDLEEFSQRIFFNVHSRFTSKFICSHRCDTSLFMRDNQKFVSYCVIACINSIRFCREANLRSPSILFMPYRFQQPRERGRSLNWGKSLMIRSKSNSDSASQSSARSRYFYIRRIENILDARLINCRGLCRARFHRNAVY